MAVTSVLANQTRDGVARVVRLARAHLPAVHFALDGALWVIAIPLGVWMRYDFGTSNITTDLVPAILLTLVLQGVIGVALGQYRRKWRYGSFDEVRMIALTAIAVGVISSVALWWNLAIPRSVPMLAAAISTARAGRRAVDVAFVRRASTSAQRSRGAASRGDRRR